MKKVPLCTSPLECAWLYHEIGRCYFAKDNYVSAKEMGEKSKTCATEADEPSWQLNALVLMGQAQGAGSHPLSRVLGASHGPPPCLVLRFSHHSEFCANFHTPKADPSHQLA